MKSCFAKVALLAAALTGSIQAGAAATDKRLAGLDRYIEQVRADWKNVGVAVAVVQGNEVLFARGFGVKQLGKPDEIDAGSLFQIGSTSKAFTTAALGILVDEGKVRWDDPVIDYLPGFQLHDPWLTRHLTVRDTIVHDSGIADSRFSSLGNMTLDDCVRQLSSIPAEAPFRNSFRYSNLMYATAGKIVEVVSGMTWHEFVKRRLLQPLEMSRSGTSPLEYWDARFVTPTFLGSVSGRPTIKDSRDANVAMPHAFNEQGSLQVLPWINYDSKAAAGAIVSSAGDMANWMILHLNDGSFRGRQLLKKETMRELHTTQNLHGRVEFPFEETGTTYAMGWFRSEYRGHPHLAHGGGIIGFPAHVALLPEQKIGVVVLSNGPAIQGFHQAIELEAFDRLLGAPRRDWNKEFLTRAKKAEDDARKADEQLQRVRLSNLPPSLPLEQFAGTYENPAMQTGRVNVRVAGGGLVLSFTGEGAFSTPLEHWQRDTFRMHPNPGVADSLNGSGHRFVSFTVDPAGAISLSGFDTTLRRLPIQ